MVTTKDWDPIAQGTLQHMETNCPYTKYLQVKYILVFLVLY